MIWFHPNREERRAALKVGADVIRPRLPQVTAPCRVWIAPNWIDAHVEWRWPGVVRVTTRYTGELIAESKPGQPYELAGDAS